MESDSFERSLRAFVRRIPFKPFVVEFASGSLLHVDHPEALVFRGGTAIHFDPANVPTLFDHTGVTKITAATEPAAT